MKKLVFHFFTILCCLSLSNSVSAKSIEFDEHVIVTMRIIGHEVLLSANDSTSRVLPIKKENGRYKIVFDTDFSFNPEELAFIIDSVSDNNQLASHYSVEVLSCDSGQVVYSYEVDKDKVNNILACKGRIQPFGCYQIMYRIISAMPEEFFQDEQTSMGSSALKKNIPPTTKNNGISFLILGLVVCILVMIGLKKRKLKKGSYLIKIGDFIFDHKNMTLAKGENMQELTGKETDLLQLLFAHLNTTVDRDEILKKVWSDEGVYIGRTLDVYISKLRKKFQSDPSINIINVRGVGYKLTLD